MSGEIVKHRQCGACTLCCKLLPVRSIAKLAGVKCVHQSSKGCAVYHKTGFPPECGQWNCRWLGDDTFTAQRPDRTHYVVDVLPDTVGHQEEGGAEITDIMCLQVWCDPHFREAWRDPALIAYAEREGMPMIVRYNSRDGIFVVPPSMTGGAGLVVMESSLDPEPSRTGSRLLDKLTQSE